MSAEATFAQFPTLTTPRLILREMRLDDDEAYFTIRSNADVLRYFGSEPHQSVAETRSYIQRVQDWYAEHDSLRWAVTQAGDDRAIGTCCLFHFDDGYHRAEIGYDSHPDYWGKGLMTEAVAAILTYAFGEMGLHRVEANIDIANERSKGLLIKLGFTYEGVLRERFVFRDRFEDEHYFGLLTHEWHGWPRPTD
jgi:[ribosomal protein S5]-alanine N-acetyltransferase